MKVKNAIVFRATRDIKILEAAIGVVLDTNGFTEDERIDALMAYYSMNRLRNSLHRFLVKK